MALDLKVVEELRIKDYTTTSSILEQAGFNLEQTGRGQLVYFVSDGEPYVIAGINREHLLLRLLDHEKPVFGTYHGIIRRLLEEARQVIK